MWHRLPGGRSVLHSVPWSRGGTSADRHFALKSRSQTACLLAHMLTLGMCTHYTRTYGADAEHGATNWLALYTEATHECVRCRRGCSTSVAEALSPNDKAWRRAVEQKCHNIIKMQSLAVIAAANLDDDGHRICTVMRLDTF